MRHGMDIGQRHKIIFLNELHDTLKLLNPRTDPSAGFYRVLGRLASYNPDTQVAILQSCFHYEHPVSELPATIIARRTEKRVGNAARPILSTSRVAVVDSSNNSSRSTIDLTLDDDSSDAENADTTSGAMSSEKNPRNGGDNNVDKQPLACIDLTCASDDEEQDFEMNTPNRRRDLGNAPDIDPGGPSHSYQTKRNHGPKITLLVDTQLLGIWSFESSALFQFTGEVLFESDCWMLQARTVRNMDGLDLYSYRESILLMRELHRHTIVNDV